MSQMHICPHCSGPRISLVDAQSLDPQTHRWVMEAYCPDCQEFLGGEVSIYQLSALADAVEEAFAGMLSEARRIEENGENWLPPGLSG